MATDPNMPTLHELSAALANLVAKVSPSIVSFGVGRARSSGFFWRPGLVVTAEETLPEEGTFPATVAGGETAEAKLIGRDPSTDIALLRVDRADLAPLWKRRLRRLVQWPSV